MKKNLLVLSGAFLLAGQLSYSQTDTLLWADFESDPSTFIQWAVPPGVTADTSWYNYDGDLQADGSGTSRPLEWFWAAGFAPPDSVQSVFASSSWTNGPTPTDNWLMTKSITIVDSNAILSWASAPYQTPRYVDGYFVLVSTTTNDYLAFTDTIFKAAEYLSLNNSAAPFVFASYSFTPGFEHGLDSTYTLLDPASDSSRLVGVLRPFSKSLKQYSGKSIYIAFDHHSDDDNLLSIDNILVTGTSTVGINEQVAAQIKFKAYPNPAVDKLYLDMTVVSSTDIAISMFDIMGREIYNENLGKLSAGKHYHNIDVAGLAAGMYQAKITTTKGSLNFKVQVK